MYFCVYSVLLIVLYTFKCTLKGARFLLNNVGKHDLTFSKNLKMRLLCACICIFCMSTSISTRVHTFPKVLTQEKHLDVSAGEFLVVKLRWCLKPNIYGTIQHNTIPYHTILYHTIPYRSILYHIQ